MEIKNFYDKNTMITEFNLNVASGDIQITPNLPIGTKLLYRKINATQGIINLIAQGSEKITKGLLSSVQLNSDGDFWLLQKVSDTRWDLLEGMETGSNANGTYIRNKEGVQVCNCAITSAITMTQTITGLYSGLKAVTLPKPFSNALATDLKVKWGILGDSGSDAISVIIQTLSMNSPTIRYYGFNPTVTAAAIYLEFTGRWY